MNLKKILKKNIISIFETQISNIFFEHGYESHSSEKILDIFLLKSNK
jgi:hypothetical protein